MTKTKKNKITLSLITLGTTGVAVAGAVGATLSSISHTTTIGNDTNLSNPGTSTGNDNINNGNTNNGSSNVGSNVNFKQTNGIVSSSNLAFAAVLSSDMLNGNTSRQASTTYASGTKEINLGANSITPAHTAGWVERTMDDGTTEKRYQSPEYYNNRTFMPILDRKEAFVSERTQNDYITDTYAGWDKEESVKKSGYSINIYNASETLKSVYSNLSKNYIRAINYNFVKNKNSDASYAEFKEIIEKEAIDFAIITIDKNTDLSKISIPDSIKKLTIKSSLGGDVTTLDGLKIPASVQEMEIYLGTGVTTVDPLMFPANCNIITDTSVSASTIFKEVKIGKANADMANKSDKLQNALDALYQYRIHERAFQGNFSGGYIGSWDLTNTKVTSFNGVTVPILNDGSGRFYVAHVEIKTDGNIPPSIGEEIEDDKVSNDSQIDSWFDWGQGWQKVQEVKVTSTKPISIDVAAAEIIGFMKKYPNIVTIDLTGINLKDGKTLDELADKVKELIPQEFGKDSPKNDILLKTNSTQLLG